MASFIYFYSKFTEEFLLLTAAGIFTLLSFYCYTWVVKKRRLGAARDQVPAGLVKVYLGQLINEAQFVRTQLFGLAGGTGPTPENLAAHFQNTLGGTTTASPQQDKGSDIPSDLFERLKALEAQLAEKESMVVNINVEKSKLLEEVENLKQNEKVMGSAVSGNNDDLINKIKGLEERLEEYALFEDDLANLKRLQQENAQLKKQLEKSNPNSSDPSTEAKADGTESGKLLDQSAIDALLDGTPAVPPTPTVAQRLAPEMETLAPRLEKPRPEPTALKPAAETAAPSAPPAAEAAPSPAPSSQQAATPAPEPAIKPETKSEDQFENLVDSIETSLEKDTKIEAASPEEMLAAPVQAASKIGDKTDEELLKEFENLLNS